LGGLCCYRGDCSGLDPLGKILDGNEGKLYVPLSRRQCPDDVQPPMLKCLGVGDELGEFAKGCLSEERIFGMLRMTW
jgi:hypothetical protein